MSTRGDMTIRRTVCLSATAFLALSAYGWYLWANRPEVQAKRLSESGWRASEAYSSSPDDSPIQLNVSLPGIASAREALRQVDPRMQSLAEVTVPIDLDISHSTWSDQHAAWFPRKYLYALKARRTQMTTKSLATLAQATNLSLLSIAECDIDPAELKQLAVLRRLHVLALDGLKAGDEDLAWIKDLPELSSLYLENTKITDRFLEWMADRERPLRAYGLSGTQITTGGIRRICRAGGIEELHLVDTRIDDEAFAAILATRTIDRLDIRRTAVSAKSLLAITAESVGRLSHLVISGGPDSPEIVRHLAKVAPRLEVVVVPNPNPKTEP